jgi:hypothetical protein
MVNGYWLLVTGYWLINGSVSWPLIGQDCLECLDIKPVCAAKMMDSLREYGVLILLG